MFSIDMNASYSNENSCKSMYVLIQLWISLMHNTEDNRTYNVTVESKFWSIENLFVKNS